MVLSSALDRSGECPECKGILTTETIRPGQFNCPYCAKYIKPRTRYLWFRAVACLTIAVAMARLSGFDWSFLIFVVGFYALPVAVLWDVIAFKMLPPTKFESVSSPFQTLGINKG